MLIVSDTGPLLHGSLGVVLWASAIGHLNYIESKDAIERLSKSSLWISKEVLLRAQKAIETMFGR